MKARQPQRGDVRRHRRRRRTRRRHRRRSSRCGAAASRSPSPEPTSIDRSPTDDSRKAAHEQHIDAHPPVWRAPSRAHRPDRQRLTGWVGRRREHGEHLAFVDLRDHTGIIQCVVNDDVDVRSEYVVRITGVVRARPEGTVNAEPADRRDRDRRVRGRDPAQGRRRRRSRSTPAPTTSTRTSDSSTATSTCVASGCRRTCASGRRSTPRSARRWSARASSRSRRRCSCRRRPRAPASSSCRRARSRARSTRCPQSPQLFKQLLMVGGVDRYYQIARCLRDEDLRADRQYEFMQLDMEMSFVDQDDVLDAVSEAVLDAAEAVTGERPAPIERMTWHDAMNRFGIDKPDLRFGMELVELTDVFADTEFKAFAGAESIKGIRVAGRGRRVRPQPARQADRPGQVARRQGPGLDEGHRRRLRLAGRQVPVRRRGRRAEARRWTPRPATSS